MTPCTNNFHVPHGWRESQGTLVFLFFIILVNFVVKDDQCMVSHIWFR